MIAVAFRFYWGRLVAPQWRRIELWPSFLVTQSRRGVDRFVFSGSCTGVAGTSVLLIVIGVLPSSLCTDFPKASTRSSYNSTPTPPASTGCSCLLTLALGRRVLSSHANILTSRTRNDAAGPETRPLAYLTSMTYYRSQIITFGKNHLNLRYRHTPSVCFTVFLALVFSASHMTTLKWKILTNNWYPNTVIHLSI